MFHAPSYPIEVLTHDSSHESTICFVSPKKKAYTKIRFIPLFSYKLEKWLLHVEASKNSQIPLFFKIISILTLFNKYVAVGSQIVAQTQVEKDMGPISPIHQICKRVGERIALMMGFSTITGS